MIQSGDQVTREEDDPAECPSSLPSPSFLDFSSFPPSSLPSFFLLPSLPLSFAPSLPPFLPSFFPFSNSSPIFPFSLLSNPCLSCQGWPSFLPPPPVPRRLPSTHISSVFVLIMVTGRFLTIFIERNWVFFHITMNAMMALSHWELLDAQTSVLMCSLATNREDKGPARNASSQTLGIPFATS